MGITIALETEDGESLRTIEDPTNVLHRVLPESGDPRYQCLSRIDWYGDTVFNSLQAPQLLAEWETLTFEMHDAEARRVLDGVRELAERLRAERHVYLKFYGD
jgi:hypothetical protein